MTIPAGDGMMAPSGYASPTAPRMRLESARSRLLRRATSLTMLASMSRANESKRWPAGVR